MNPSQKSYTRSYNNKKKAQPQSMDEKIRLIVQQEARKASKKKESKMFDLAITAVSVTFDGVVYNLTNGITQGSGDTNYIGSTINPTTLRIRWNATAADATQMFRVIVLQTIGGGTPTAATTLQSVGNIRAPFSPYERAYMNTFKVLSDELYSMVLNTEAGQIVGDIRIRFNKLRPLSFTNASGTVEDNGIYLILISDSSASTHPVFQAYSRLYFKDD